MNKTDHNTKSTDELRSMVAEHRASRCRQYPASIRQACLAHLASGYAVEALAKTIMVKPSLLYSWKKTYPRRTSVRSIEPRAVAVTPKRTSTMILTGRLRFCGGSFSLLLPCGDERS